MTALTEGGAVRLERTVGNGGGIATAIESFGPAGGGGVRRAPAVSASCGHASTYPAGTMTASAASSSAARDGRLLRVLAAAVVATWALAAMVLVRSIQSAEDDAIAALAAAGLIAVTATLAAAVVVRSIRSQRRTTGVLESIAALTDPALMRLEPDELVGELLVRIHDAIRPDLAGVVIVDPASGELSLLELRSAGGEVLRGRSLSSSGLLAAVVSTGAPVLSDDVPVDAGLGELGDRTIRSFVGCAMTIEGRPMGVAFSTDAKPRAFDLEAVRLLQRVADRVALALERDRLDESEREGREAVAEGEARLRSLVDAAPLGILELDERGQVQRWNRAACELLDWPPFAADRAPALPNELATKVADLVTATRRRQKAEAVEARVDRRGGPAVVLHATSAPLEDADGHLVGVLLLLSDVTERRQLEQHIRQAQRLDAMSRLAGGVAHDFNNLLTVIVGYSQFLLEQLPADSPVREDVEAIGKAGNRASELTKQLLTIGRRQVVDPVVLDAQERIADLEPIIRRLVGDRIEVRVVTGPSEANVRVDAHELEQVVMNLVINARDAMPSGGRLVVESRSITLDAVAARTAAVEPGAYVLITVADTGGGMTDEVREHCFDPFFTTKGRGKGTGLGLAAVYGVVTQAGGALDVQSELGRGTTFRLFFPLAAEAAEEPAAKKPARRRRVDRSGRILLVEDEDAVRNLARAVLEDRGHSVVEVDSGEAALALAKKIKQPFDVLVSDIVMPGMHGDELARELTELWPDLRVLLVSGYVERAASLDPSRTTFLAKPFALDELTDAVQDLLRRAAKAGTVGAGTVKARSGSRRPARSGPSAASADPPRSGGGRGGRAR